MYMYVYTIQHAVPNVLYMYVKGTCYWYGERSPHLILQIKMRPVLFKSYKYIVCT